MCQGTICSPIQGFSFSVPSEVASPSYRDTASSQLWRPRRARPGSDLIIALEYGSVYIGLRMLCESTSHYPSIHVCYLP